MKSQKKYFNKCICDTSKIIYFRKDYILEMNYKECVGYFRYDMVK